MSFDSDGSEWIYPKIAAKMIGIGAATLLKRAARLGIRVRKVPGLARSKVNSADVRRFLAEMEASENATVAEANSLGDETRRTRKRRKVKTETARPR